jgi:hypothetical protein
MPEHRPTFAARKGNPGFGWVVDILWPDGDTEVIKGFATPLADTSPPLAPRRTRWGRALSRRNYDYVFER